MKAIALETLTGIRESGNKFLRERTVQQANMGVRRLGRDMRWLLGNWSFYQLRQYITYKAEQVGIDVIGVPPQDTSRTCSVSLFCDKANRRSQSHFLCLSCGFQANADYNASANIARSGSETRAHRFLLRKIPSQSA